MQKMLRVKQPEIVDEETKEITYPYIALSPLQLAVLVHTSESILPN